MTNLGARPRRSHKTEPSRVGGGQRRGVNFHHIAVFKRSAQRHLFAVDFGRQGAVTHIAVNGVSKIHDRGAPGQGHDLALGRQHVNGVWKQIDLDVVPELGRIARLVLNVKQRLEPLGAQAIAIGGVGRVVDLVQPMRRHTGFRHDVHGLGAHLKLHIHARGADQGGVQRLVAIDFADGNVVFELAGNRFVELMQKAQRCVAVNHAGHDDPKAINIGDLGKAQVLLRHFLIDGVQRLFTPGNAHIHVAAGKRHFHFALDFVNQVTPAAARFGHGLGQNTVAPRL